MFTNFRSFAKIDGANDVVILSQEFQSAEIYDQYHHHAMTSSAMWLVQKQLSTLALAPFLEKCERGIMDMVCHFLPIMQVTDVACKNEKREGKKSTTLMWSDFPKLSQIKIGSHGHFFAHELPKVTE